MKTSCVNDERLMEVIRFTVSLTDCGGCPAVDSCDSKDNRECVETLRKYVGLEENMIEVDAGMRDFPKREMTVAELIYILQNCFLPLDKVEMTCIATEYGHAKLVVKGRTVMEYEN